ncbi:MAG TPA: helix-turn-helix transcriptional regulator [Actinophytocola sp.]|uniref:helix-turn-helix domain-containing protein n=1 Tax=Actinophytocola sp. TaxID=1872138 RepID=UPI002DFC70DA|nr:helix-turn-helix transcriptional regulator [Actinophytocola sp.]
MATATRLKKRLGRLLREVRERSGKPALAAAAELKQSTASTLNRYETGEVLPAWGTVRTLLTFYEATAEDLDQASRCYDDAKDEPRSVRLPAGAPSGYRRLVNAEREAVRERELAPLVVPGLLQTERYTRALLDAGRILERPETRADSVVAVRMDRQKPLDGPDPLIVHALIDEAVIHREVGDVEVQREQLVHLLAMAEQPNISVQVIPFAAGAYGTMAGSCIIVDYPEPDATSGVYLEYPAGGAWVDNEEDVKRFTTMFDEVTRLALTPADTATLIKKHVRALKN